MRFALIAALGLVASTAAADPAPKKSPAPTTAAKPADAKPACVRKVVGRGLDRKVVCEFEDPIVVGASAPQPKVLIVPTDGKKVVGRPKLTDPFAGLPRRRSTSL